jgi:hypothetical protein
MFAVEVFLMGFKNGRGCKIVFFGVLKSDPSVQAMKFFCELKFGTFPCFQKMVTICFMRSLEVVSVLFIVVFGKFVCESCLLIPIIARKFSLL